MRTWTRAASDALCGRCAGEIRPGDPVLMIQVAMVKKRLTRCEQCADEPVPDMPLQRAPEKPQLRSFESLLAIKPSALRPFTWDGKPRC